jgi:hypothetical protein
MNCVFGGAKKFGPTALIFSFSLISTTSKEIGDVVAVVVVAVVVVVVVQHPRVGLKSRECWPQSKKMRGKLELACITFIVVQCCQMKTVFSQHLCLLILSKKGILEG